MKTAKILLSLVQQSLRSWVALQLHRRQSLELEDAAQSAGLKPPSYQLQAGWVTGGQKS